MIPEHKIIKNEDTNNNKDLKSSVVVEMFEGVLGFICGERKRNARLLKESKDDLTKLFGKHNCTYSGGEFFNRIWIVNFKGEEFHIFTSKRGTQFSIVAKYKDKKSDICIEFLTEFDKLIKGLEDGN